MGLSACFVLTFEERLVKHLKGAIGNSVGIPNDIQRGIKKLGSSINAEQRTHTHTSHACLHGLDTGRRRKA